LRVLQCWPQARSKLKRSTRLPPTAVPAIAAGRAGAAQNVPDSPCHAQVPASRPRTTGVVALAASWYKVSAGLQAAGLRHLANVAACSVVPS
jgi:hypothetical protein